MKLGSGLDVKIKHLVYSYLFYKLTRIEYEMLELKNNTYFRSMDEVDHLEYIIATTRMKMFLEINRDLHEILMMRGE